MDRYHVVSLFGSETCDFSRESERSATIENLRRKVRKMHARHLFACLLRAGVLGVIIVLALNRVESSWGNALAITCGFLLVHTLLFSIKGHWSIVRFKNAKMYWLQDSTVDQDLSPVYLQIEAPDLAKKTA